MAGASSFLPVLVTDIPRRDPYDDAMFPAPLHPLAAHPISCTLGSLATLPKNFGRSSKDDPSSAYAGGVAAIAWPLNYAGLGSLMLMVHPKIGGVSSLAKGWVQTPLYMNFGDPIDNFSAQASLGAQDTGEFVYCGVDLNDFLVGSGGASSEGRRTILYRFNRIDAVQTRYIFNGEPHDNRVPAPMTWDMYVTDTNPPFVFFYDLMSTWHMLDDGAHYPGHGVVDDLGQEVGDGQYGATRYDLSIFEPYRPDTIYLNDGTSMGARGLQVFRSWTAPTFWPELWIVNAQYPGGEQRAWNGWFDIYRVPNTAAGSTTVPTVPGWDTAWMGHHYSKLPPLPGLDLATDMPRSLTFRFHKDRHLTNVLYVTATGLYTTHTGDAYQNAWYAKSPDDGKTWGNWTRGQIAYSYDGDAPPRFDHSTVGIASSSGFEVAMSPPVLTSSNELIMSIAYSEQHGDTSSLPIYYPTLYAITFKGQSGATAAQQLTYFKRGELNRVSWL